MAMYRLLLLGLMVVQGVAPAGPWRTYFPAEMLQYEESCPQVFPPRSSYRPMSEFVLGWYSGQLQAAQEPSLLPGSGAGEAAESYRFTWLRTFHHPVTVRIERLRSGRWRLTGKQLSGAGGYAPGVVEKTVQRLLTRGEEISLQTALRDHHALALPMTVCASEGADGSEWLFETSTQEGYRFAKQWTPKDGDLRALGLTFLELSGFVEAPLY